MTTRYTGDSHGPIPRPLRWILESPPALRIAAGLSLLFHAAAGGVLLLSPHGSYQLADAPIDGEMQTIVTLTQVDTPALTKEPRPEPMPERSAEPEPAPTPPPRPAPQPEIHAQPEPVSSADAAPPPPPTNQSGTAPTTASTPRTAAPAGPPAEAPQLREIAFAGLKAKRAARIVYVVDASGPMVSHWAWAASQLRTSLGRLDQTQQFQVLVTRLLPATSGEAVTSRRPEVLTFLDNNALHTATQSSIAGAVVWLSDQRVRGAPDPLPGLARALTLKPDLILLLSHSFEQGLSANVGRTKDAVLAELDRLNPRQSDGRRAVIIKTIQLGGDDPTGLLQSIALEHGDGPGSYHSVTPAELGDATPK